MSYTVSILVIVGLMTTLVIQAREARINEARASLAKSPLGQAWAKKARAERLWFITYREVMDSTDGDFISACRAAEDASRPCFEAARAAAKKAKVAETKANEG